MEAQTTRQHSPCTNTLDTTPSGAATAVACTGMTQLTAIAGTRHRDQELLHRHRLRTGSRWTTDTGTPETVPGPASRAVSQLWASGLPAGERPMHAVREAAASEATRAGRGDSVTIYTAPEVIGQEERIVWLTYPECLEAVCEGRISATQRGNRLGRSCCPGELVAYAVFKPTVRRHWRGDRFFRCVCWLSPAADVDPCSIRLGRPSKVRLRLR